MKDEMNIGEGPARFSYYKEAGKISLLPAERNYSFLFVLQGRVEMHSPCHTEVFESRTMAVIDKQQIDTCICTAGTWLLEFLPPKRIDTFFVSASRVFGTPTSDHIAYSEDLERWIAQLRSDCLQGIPPDEYSYCCQLRGILRQYPDIALGTLVIPLHACALTSKKCMLCRGK